MTKKKGGRKAAFWEGGTGWKAVEIGDDVLLGSEEFGFAGLEELDPKMLGKSREAPAGCGTAGALGSLQVPCVDRLRLAAASGARQR